MLRVFFFFIYKFWKYYVSEYGILGELREYENWKKMPLIVFKGFSVTKIVKLPLAIFYFSVIFWKNQKMPPVGFLIPYCSKLYRNTISQYIPPKNHKENKKPQRVYIKQTMLLKSNNTNINGELFQSTEINCWVKDKATHIIGGPWRSHNHITPSCR